MVQIGKWNRLSIVEIAENGVYLDGQEDGEIFLPAAEADDRWQAGDTAEFFIYFAGNDLAATTKSPYVEVGQFACLRVNSIQSVGAFLDWGLPKDLFLPFREQTREFRDGHYVVVYVYLDSSGRISASMRTDKYVDTSPSPYEVGEQVELLIVSQTDLGFKAIVNDRHVGVIYANEIFEPVRIGDRKVGYVKHPRPDGKIDLSLAQIGYRGSDDIGERIMEMLVDEGGFLGLDDKSSAEDIYRAFGVSKKKFKMAVGGLLKKQLIGFADGGMQIL